MTSPPGPIADTQGPPSAWPSTCHLRSKCTVGVQKGAEAPTTTRRFVSLCGCQRDSHTYRGT